MIYQIFVQLFWAIFLVSFPYDTHCYLPSVTLVGFCGRLSLFRGVRSEKGPCFKIPSSSQPIKRGMMYIAQLILSGQVLIILKNIIFIIIKNLNSYSLFDCTYHFQWCTYIFIHWEELQRYIRSLTSLKGAPASLKSEILGYSFMSCYLRMIKIKSPPSTPLVIPTRFLCSSKQYNSPYNHLTNHNFNIKNNTCLKQVVRKP